jgi:predicted ribonuclease YlaK
MVITGDPHQVFNKHMNYHSNGLMYAATKMAGSPYAAVITMLQGELTRSEAAREIARRLDH